MKILMIGDIVGRPGRMAMARIATRYKAEGRADAVIANAENSAAGAESRPSWPKNYSPAAPTR